MDTEILITMYLIGGAVAIGILLAASYYVWRWIFSVKRQLWNQQQQINILLMIAEKLGVDMQDSKINTISYYNNEK
jgi:hypothetical protein